MRYNEIKELYKKHGYKFFTAKYALNIFGIRNGLEIVDHFNDIIGVAYKDYFGNEICLVFNGTTKPGINYLREKMGNADGTFILKPGQYTNCWRFGKHSGKYDALRQNGSNVFIGWRDSDRDGAFDIGGDEKTDVTGLNLHTTSFIRDKGLVGAYSAGCQVVQEDKEFLILMAIINNAREDYGNDVFSYTLFDKE